MADNLTIKDGNGASATLKTTDSSGHCPHHRITDGTNFMPTMDAAARTGFVQISNGTIQLGVFAEDAAHSSGHTGFMPLAVQNATHTNALSGTDGDYTPFAVDGTGKLGIRGTFAEDAGHTSGDLGVHVLTVRQDTAAALGGTDADYQSLITDASGRLWTHVGAIEAGSNTIGGIRDAGPAWTSVFGVSGARFTSADASASPVAVTDAPTAGQKLVITDLIVSIDTARTVNFTCETSGVLIATLYMAANTTVQVQLRGKVKLATADKKLMVQTSGAGNISVTAVYYSEA